MERTFGTLLKRFLLFVAVMFPMYWVFTAAWGSFMADRYKPNLNYRIGTYGHMLTRMQEIKAVKKTDVVFAGSSHAYRGFDPRIFKAAGYRSFNTGSSSQTPLQTEVIFKRYIDRLQPDLVVFELTPFSLSSDGVESSVDIIANDNNDLHSAIMALKINHITTYNTLLYGLYRDLFSLNAEEEEPRKRPPDTYIEGGFVEREVDRYRPHTEPQREFVPNPAQVKALKNCISLAENTGARVVLVRTPVTRGNYEAVGNTETFNGMLDELGEYYDFNEIADLNDTVHFYDKRHLNQIGVEAFNRKLIEVLDL